MMRKYLQSLVACLVCWMVAINTANAQDRCRSMELLANTLKKSPTLKTKFELQKRNVLQEIAARKAMAQQLRIEGAISYIPVVFHIVLQKPTLVRDAQIQAQ